MSSCSSAGAAGRDGHRRAGAALRGVLLCLLGVVLTGCIRFDADLTVSEDQTVSGTMVIATRDISASGRPTTAELPPQLQKSVKVDPYAQDGYYGSRLSLVRVPFDQFELLFRQLGRAVDSRGAEP